MDEPTVPLRSITPSLHHDLRADRQFFLLEGSPDRADALVWALTELMLDGTTFTLACEKARQCQAKTDQLS
ncbi:hypothetical protein NKH10_32400 [Mesorhizobium sp. M1340]|uniref:hypothetical protein n=1 Tax=unclassified Mesorhizobium TaxID=325217 RepID=UPI0033364119